MKKICRNCKFFKRSDIYPGFGTCKEIRVEMDPIDGETDRIFVNGDPYELSVYVGEQFSCIHFVEDKRKTRKRK